VSRSAGSTGNFVHGGGTNSSSNGFVITSATAGFLDAGLFYGGSSFAWEDSAGGFVRGIDYGVDNGTRTTGATASNVGNIAHQQFTGAATNQTTGTFTTLAFTQTGTTYTISSGTVTVAGILKSGVGTTTMSGGSGIRAATVGADLVVRTDLSSGTLAINNVILANGTSGLTKAGAGSLSLGGNNTFTGNAWPAEGTLVVATANALQNATLNMAAGGAGTVTFNQNSTLGGLTGSRNLDFGGRQVSVGNSNGSTSHSGILSSGTLVKIGTGTLALSGSSTLAAATSINNGTVAIDWLTNTSQPSPLGTAALINLGSGSTGGTLRYTGSGHTTDRAINLSGTTGGGTIEAAGSGALQLTGASTATGVGTKTLTLTGTSTAANTIGSIAGTGVSVNKTGSGLWRLTGASNYDGRLVQQQPVWLELGNCNAARDRQLVRDCIRHGGVARGGSDCVPRILHRRERLRRVAGRGARRNGHRHDELRHQCGATRPQRDASGIDGRHG
jgi:fibronectin-binding autotransporter adhesin